MGSVLQDWTWESVCHNRCQWQNSLFQELTKGGAANSWLCMARWPWLLSHIQPCYFNPESHLVSVVSWTNLCIDRQMQLNVMWHFLQYFSPYLSADMRKMAEAFNTSIGALEDELMQLILDGQIKARIDSHNKVIVIHCCISFDSLYSHL